MNQTIHSAELEPPQQMGDNDGEAPPRRSLAPSVDPAVDKAEAELLAAYVEDTDKYLMGPLDKDARKESEGDSKRMIAEAEMRWGKPTAANCISWDADSGLLFTADDMGVLRCFNVTKAIADVTWQPKPKNWNARGDSKEKEAGEGEGEGGAQAQNVGAEEVKAAEKEPSHKESNAAISLAGSESSSQVDFEEEKDESQWHCRSYIRGFCRNRVRAANCAVPPVPFKDKERDVRYLVTGTNNPSGNHGVDFCWALQAHGDRIVTCLTNEHGCLTSGADMLVKMWSFTGEPLGVLVQSVPVGRRNQKWELMLDAEGIMKREKEELDEIIEQVEELAQDPELPNIYDMDFANMEPGANAEDFTRSELRQRIGQTSAKLGIHFPVEGEEADSDEEHIKSVAGGKSLSSALHELRSTRVKQDAEINIQARREESDMTRKRREKKFEETSRKYEKLAGMRVGPPGSDSGVLDRDVDLKEIRALAGHGVNTSAEEQSEARDSVAQEPSQDLGESSVNFDDLASLVSSLGVPGSVQGVGESINNQIGSFSQKGKRTQQIAKTCKKYDNWSKLEQALEASTKKLRGGVPPRPPKLPRK